VLIAFAAVTEFRIAVNFRILANHDSTRLNGRNFPC
jgi:hypothetical protein